MRRFFAAATALWLAGCATTPPVASLPAASVAASGETVPVGTANADAADDPAIWRNPDDPAASLIVATDKKAGLYVYGLDGKVRDFAGGGLLNNVDLVDLGEGRVIVAASDRNDPARAGVRFYRLETAGAKLIPIGRIEAGTGEGYGLCMAHIDGDLRVVSALKNGRIEEQSITFAAGGPVAETVRSMALASQPEGCVYDPRTRLLYIGEETRGIWRFAPTAETGELVALTDGSQLVADVEGLAIAPEGADGGWLVASSQGDNAFAVYALPGMTFFGRFRIAAGVYGATEETDGIALETGSMGALYPDGLFVAQDGANGAEAQNFKLVSWSDIRRAVGL